jgi:subtilisin family serine protease
LTFFKKCRVLAVLAAAWAATLVPAAAAEPEYVEGEVIVTFKPGTSEQGARTKLGRKSLAFARRFDLLSEKRGRQTGLVRRQDKSTAELIQDLQNDPDVEHVEPNYLRHVSAVTNDSRFGELWGLRNTGQTVDGVKGTAGADIKFAEAWDMARLTNTEIVVGVIDTGVDFTHPDLQANMWVNAGEVAGNNRDDDGNGYIDDVHGYDFSSNRSDPSDADTHGTHVAGTIAAVGNNENGVVGVNYRAKIIAMRVSTTGTSISTSAVIEAIQYATMMKGKGVNIVALNASYGGGGFSTTERAAIQAAGNAGIIMIAAAGNDTANNDVTNTYPANYRLPNMIVVAATDSKDVLATFSNYGATKVDIAAPGTKILSAQPADVTVRVGNTTYNSSAMEYSGKTQGLTGKIYDCGIGEPNEFPAQVAGNIALIERGTLTFAQKAANAKAAGAVAVIIYNNVSGSFEGTLGTPGDWLPTRALARADGLSIKALTPVDGALVRASGFQFLQGTSMATPHVTGAVAFAAMNYPTETVASRIQRILSNVDTKTALSGKVVTGGRLNLLRTVDTNANNVADWLEPTGANPPTIATGGTLPGGAVSEAYAQTVSATGGKSPYAWSLISGSLPPGLTLSSGGAIQGSPTTSGPFVFALRVTDGNGATNARQFSLTIAATPLAIASAGTLEGGRVNVGYMSNLSAVGGTPSYVWSLTAGALPAGVQFYSSGLIYGTPTAHGTFSFTAKVTDGATSTATKTFSLTIEPPPLNITTTSSLPVGAVSMAYAQALAVTGGAGPHSWTVDAGSLPAGVSLSSQGVISGTPSSFGSFAFTARVTDSASRTLTKQFNLYIQEVPLAISNAPELVAGVKSLAYKQNFVATGGAGSYVWSLGSGVLPTGMKLSPAGLLSGTPTAAGDFAFTLVVRDLLGLQTSQSFTWTITATYLIPVLEPVELGTTTVGMPFTYALKAANYPKSFSITKLPPGLTGNATTGVITGRLTTPGVYEVVIKATNPAGTHTVLAPMVVRALPDGFVGSFTGIIERDGGANGNLGGRLNVTTTKAGAFTARITTGATSKSVSGFLADTAPHIRVPVGAQLLSLTFGGSNDVVTGTHGAANVSGWRSSWSAARPATSRAGYYTLGINLADAASDGVESIPQGSGYASFTVAAAGTLTVAGRAADGSVFTSASFLGPNGEIAVYSPLYGNLGSLAGILGLTDEEESAPVDNTVSGNLTWLKPITKTRTYAGGFGPLSLNAYGRYLAATSSKGIATGLPETGAVSLHFADGGLANAAIDPDVGSFDYTATKTVVLPAAGSTGNPAKVTLTINKTTGLIGGTFILVEPTPALTRRVTFQGMIIRPESGNAKGQGYFLLPQIPRDGETIATSPILSGRVLVEQTPVAE